MSFQQTQEGIYLRKIGRRKEEIRRYLTSNATPITEITYRETKDYERYEDAVKARGYRPIKVGETWGAGGSNAWFKVKLSIPREFAGREVVACFKFGKYRDEACLFLNGKPFAGMDRFHDEVLLAKKAKGGETFEFVVDARAGAPWDPEGSDTEYSNLPATLERAEIATRNPEVSDYWYSLDLLHLLAERLPADSTRRAKIVYTLNKSVDAFDYTNTDDASLRKSAIAANKVLQPLLECKADASALDISVVGHSHIDAAWRWPFKETVRKCSRTFSTQLRIMEQYPEYIYSQGQALLYSFAKKHYPALYEEVKKRVKEGRWDVTGSMWVEADCNLSSGESLVRQVLIGKNFFMDEFGIETDVLWLPDVFGYSAALPQILKKARVNYFFTNKIHWSDTNKPPYGTFHWQGIDGTQVLAHFPPSSSYNGFPSPEWLLSRYTANWQDKDRTSEILFTYGWGDGGGGPEPRHLEYLRREKDLEGLPRTTQRKVGDFFHGIDNGTDYHKWVGELYLEYHRGTYTTQGRNKRLNRKAELLYRDAELLSSIVAPMGIAYPYDELHEQWKEILANQFHDVIPGTSVRYVYEQTDESYAKAFRVGSAITAQAMSKIAEAIDTTGDGKAIVVFNTLPWERTGLAAVEIPGEGDYAVVDSAGDETPSQVAEGAIEFVAIAPSMGYSSYRLVEKAPSKPETGVKVSKTHLENDFYKIELDSNGLIKSILHKATGREVIPDGARGNLFQMFEDKPLSWPAWDIDFYHEDKFEDITSVESISIVAEGPVYGAVEVERKFGSSHIKQRIVVYAGSPRIDFETWIDWHEDQKVLKVAFPVDVNSPTARYEIQFGNVERPTHRNTSWDFAKFEVCAHKWADLSESDFGMSLMNDCKYGHSTKGNVMRLTLLRSAKSPDPMADMCEHAFTYSLMPHAGDYVEAGTVREAYGLNVPLRAIAAEPSKGNLPKEKSFIYVDAENVVLETVKRAEKEDATILRFYECHNQRSQVTVTVDLPFTKVHECDLMEDNIGEVKSSKGQFSFEIKPFEIRTFKLK